VHRGVNKASGEAVAIKLVDRAKTEAQVRWPTDVFHAQGLRHQF
jgi:hypothetical protein